nr:MAG TPA: hypothetical protein [Caudoviricetes sp.]
MSIMIVLLERYLLRVKRCIRLVNTSNTTTYSPYLLSLLDLVKKFSFNFDISTIMMLAPIRILTSISSTID